jgi:uncharacterized protein
MSINPLDWICPLLAVDADAFNDGGTPEFAAISAVARHHNDISNTLSTAPHRFQPMHRRKPNGDVDARPWCQGFHAAMRLRLLAWAPLLDLSSINHGLLQPILLHCIDSHGRPLLGPARKGRETEEFLRNAHTALGELSQRRMVLEQGKAARLCTAIFARTIFARVQAIGERRPSHNADAVLGAERHEFVFDVALGK